MKTDGHDFLEQLATFPPSSLASKGVKASAGTKIALSLAWGAGL